MSGNPLELVREPEYPEGDQAPVPKRTAVIVYYADGNWEVTVRGSEVVGMLLEFADSSAHDGRDAGADVLKLLQYFVRKKLLSFSAIDACQGFPQGMEELNEEEFLKLNT